MPSEQYPMQEEAMELANRGRYGDTTLVHMTPGEVQGLASLGQLTINPETGLPEAFSLKSILPMVANVGLAIATGGMSVPAQMAIMGAANFGMGLIQGQSAEQALLSGLTSAATTGIFSALSPSLSGAAGKAVVGTGEQAAAQAAQQAAAESATQAAAEQAAWGAFGDLGSTFNPSTGIPPLSSSLAAVPADATTQAAVGSMMADPYLITNTAMADPYLITNTATAPSFGAELANVAGIPEPLLPTGIKLDKAIEPNWFQRNVLGETTKYAKGDIVPLSEFKGKGIFGGDIPYQDMSFKERISANIKNPVSYAPVVTGLVTGAFNKPYKEPEPEEPKPVETGFDKFKLVGGDVRRPIPTAAEYRRRAVEGGSERYFDPYRYVRSAAEGGIVGLQQGGMATPQAPSAMASMLTQPQPQQPLPSNVQVQPQQPQPSMPMSQTGSGVAPLPDQQQEFIKLMDMEEQVQSQKSSQSTQALANIMGLGMNFASNQYPQTSPSGQAVQPPSPPPMNYGSQVNLGLAGGGQPYFEGVDGAMLSPDEYVLAADVVSAIGNGSSDAGAEKLDQFMKSVRQDAYGTTKQMQPFNNQGLTNLVA
jgi:hypothetical protein